MISVVDLNSRKGFLRPRFNCQHLPCQFTHIEMSHIETYLISGDIPYRNRYFIPHIFAPPLFFSHTSLKISLRPSWAIFTIFLVHLSMAFSWIRIEREARRLRYQASRSSDHSDSNLFATLSDAPDSLPQSSRSPSNRATPPRDFLIPPPIGTPLSVGLDQLDEAFPSSLGDSVLEYLPPVNVSSTNMTAVDADAVSLQELPSYRETHSINGPQADSLASPGIETTSFSENRSRSDNSSDYDSVSDSSYYHSVTDYSITDSMHSALSSDFESTSEMTGETLPLPVHDQTVIGVEIVEKSLPTNTRPRMTRNVPLRSAGESSC